MATVLGYAGIPQRGVKCVGAVVQHGSEHKDLELCDTPIAIPTIGKRTDIGKIEFCETTRSSE